MCENKHFISYQRFILKLQRSVDQTWHITHPIFREFSFLVDILLNCTTFWTTSTRMMILLTIHAAVLSPRYHKLISAQKISCHISLPTPELWLMELFKLVLKTCLDNDIVYCNIWYVCGTSQSQIWQALRLVWHSANSSLLQPNFEAKPLTHSKKYSFQLPRLFQSHTHLYRFSLLSVFKSMPYVTSLYPTVQLLYIDTCHFSVNNAVVSFSPAFFFFPV
jgi:hypothetical protein